MTLRILLALLLCAAVTLFSSCSPPPPPNVLLISVDTLRADRLGCYGYPRPTSPFLDELAAGGTLFENTTAQSPWTLPSHATLLTGLLPHRHGVIASSLKLAENVPTLASILKARGYETAAVVNSQWISPEQGLSAGFDHFDHLGKGDNRGQGISRRSLKWLRERSDARRDQPFFLFLHYYDVHSSYTPMPAIRRQFSSPYRGTVDGSNSQLLDVRAGNRTLSTEDVRHLSDLYDAEIRSLDTVLALLFIELENLGLLKNLLVVVTSDHGEEFMEHGGVLHGRTMYEEVLRVPLILSGPGVPAGRRVREPAMVVDVASMILARVGAGEGVALDGMDLIAEPADADRVVFAAADWKRAEPDSLRMLRKGSFKLVVDRLSGQRQLFDLSDDPGETLDVAADHPELVSQLAEQLEHFLTPRYPASEAGPRSQDEIEALKALGYFHD